MAAQLDTSLIIDDGGDGRRVKRARVSEGDAEGEDTPEAKAERVARQRQEAKVVGEKILQGLMEARDDL